jgi:uncharacterized protein YkwD
MAGARFFAHDTPAGSSVADRVQRAGYGRASGRWSIGENIGWGAGRMASPRAIVSAWMESPPHRANILSGRFREIGVGVALGAPVRLGAAAGGAIYTTDFGRRE